MLASLATALIGAVLFGAAGLCGIVAANALIPRLERFEDGPPPVNVPPAALIAGAAILGAIIGFHGIPLAHLIVYVFVTVCLTGIWYCDAKTGIVPDILTLPPLVLVAGYGLLTHDPTPIFSALVLFVPFAILALISRGRGMGWGDAKLAALGGALLGVSAAAIAFVIASLVAALVAWLRYRKRNAPIALAPYLVAAVAVALALNLS